MFMFLYLLVLRQILKPKEMKQFNVYLGLFFMLSFSSIRAQVSPETALIALKEGNSRFVAGKSIKPHQDVNRIKELATGQKPFAVIVGCSDSRVPSEIIFDQGLGDLFIVRTAGQVSSYASFGSVEFANAVLGAKLIVVFRTYPMWCCSGSL